MQQDDLPPDSIDLGIKTSQSRTDTTRQNGEKTNNRGPCRCGYKHWCDGEEFDFAAQYRFDGMKLSLGFNRGDNATVRAEEFVTKHNICKNNPFNAGKTVNEIAGVIREHSLQKGYDIDQDQPADGAEAKARDDWDPTKAKFQKRKPVFQLNKVTGKMEKTMYAGDDPFHLTDERKREIEEREELARKQEQQVQEALQQKYAKTGHILEQIKRDQDEVAADNERMRLVRQNYVDEKKPPGTHKWIGANGIEWITLEELYKRRGEAGTLNKYEEETFKEATGGFGQLSSLNSSNKTKKKLEIEYPHDNMNVKDITTGHVLAKVKQDGFAKCIQWLKSYEEFADGQAEKIVLSVLFNNSGPQKSNRDDNNSDDDNNSNDSDSDDSDGHSARKHKHKATNTKWGSGHTLEDKDDMVVSTSQDLMNEGVVEGYKITLNSSVKSANLRFSASNRREVVEVNVDNTLQDLYNHIRTVLDLSKDKKFVLTTGYPKKQLVEFEKTIEELDLNRANLFVEFI